MLNLDKSEFHNPVDSRQSASTMRKKGTRKQLNYYPLFLSKSHFVFIYNFQSILLNSEEFDKYFLSSENQYRIAFFSVSNMLLFFKSLCEI